MNKVFDQVVSKIEKIENNLTNIISHIYKLEGKIDIIDDRTKSYPKLYDNVDKLIGEIVENRQERVFINEKLNSHDNRITVLEHNKTQA